MKASSATTDNNNGDGTKQGDEDTTAANNNNNSCPINNNNNNKDVDIEGGKYSFKSSYLLHPTETFEGQINHQPNEHEKKKRKKNLSYYWQWLLGSNPAKNSSAAAHVAIKNLDASCDKNLLIQAGNDFKSCDGGPKIQLGNNCGGGGGQKQPFDNCTATAVMTSVGECFCDQKLHAKIGNSLKTLAYGLQTF